jgi:hypothetical protein
MCGKEGSLLLLFHEHNQVIFKQTIVKGNEKQSNLDSIFINNKTKQPNNMIIRKLNKFHHHKFEFVKLLK